MQTFDTTTENSLHTAGRTAVSRGPVLETSDGSVPMNWYALYVKSRHEFVAACELMKRGIDSFLPTMTTVRQWSDRKKQVEQVLFPGYLFVRIPHESERFVEVLRTRGSVTFVSLEPGFPTPIPNEEIESLRLMLESGADIQLYGELKQGCRVRVTKGPLESAQGVLCRRENRCLFQVNIELLGRSVSVDISPDDLEAV